MRDLGTACYGLGMTQAEHRCRTCRALPVRPAPDLVQDGVQYRPAVPRPISPKSGPRSPECATHQRELDKRKKSRARTTQRATRFGLSPDLQAAVWAAQGFACPCGNKRGPEPVGVTVDHDHDLAEQHGHADRRACDACAIGFLCTACNRDIVGRLTSPRRGGRAGIPAALRALADFLDHPPVARVLAERATIERSA